ncbi:PepSY-associated TM helix domain-containing protein [Paracoccus spongiarum]|uniref:PepSY domain-containing protein n=1 Tax=Paracoccus spongiarum TaxID=3064387 RepID=A0ABT9J6U8_9RHOB|nr:PepSY domain-containing protein [Paracoccus sp. 2205BS29-5]MDP5305501.1 PepSY domain-containing protein [Paracoccus sp. 2205BS29-5]
MAITDGNFDAAHPVDPGRAAKLYRAAWRWHFYAGIVVVPFFLMLAVTGMMMLWIAWIDGRDGERTAVIPTGAALAVSAQADAALAAVPGGKLVQYVAPRTPDLAAIFRVDDAEGAAQMVVVDPYRATVLDQFPRRSGWDDWADNFHGTLMLGVTGDRMIEIAASLGVVLLATGLYLWWPREGGVLRAFVPRLSARGRGLWKSLHATIGVWISVFLFFFLVSGLSWSGVWGEKLVQAWSSFPAGKYDNIPLSDDVHATMNHGAKEVPWALEQTPMPASGSQAGHDGIAGAVDLDSVDALARQIGYDARYQLNLPQSDNGVWTLSRDSMSTDSTDPTSDRVVHVDRFSGRILADIRYQDYSLMGKAMAVGVALHMGTLGLWSVLANTLFCLSVIFLCLSGLVMWWKRRPAGQARLVAPPLPENMPFWKGAVAVGLAVSLAFPMAGLTLAAVLLADLLVLSRLPGIRRAFG